VQLGNTRCDLVLFSFRLCMRLEGCPHLQHNPNNIKGSRLLTRSNILLFFHLLEFWQRCLVK
jgi:hypothetical protein